MMTQGGLSKERILLIPFSGLGDLMMHLRLAEILKQDFEVDLVIDSLYEAVGNFLKEHRIISNFRLCRQSKNLLGLIRKAKLFLMEVEPRAYKHILIYDRPLFTMMSLLPRYRNAIRYTLLRKRLHGPKGITSVEKNRNQTEAVLDFARSLSYPVNGMAYTFPPEVVAHCEARAERWLSASGDTHPRKRLISVSPFATHPYKKAPDNLFTAVLRSLMRGGFCTIMIGSQQDIPAAEAFSRPFEGSPRFLNLVGKLSWEETIGILCQSRLFLCNDGGIMHVSLACRTKTVAFFGPTDPYTLVLKSNQHLQPVFLALPCQPCWQKGPMGRFRCPEVKKACLEYIATDQVINLISGLLAAAPPDPVGVLPPEWNRRDLHTPEGGPPDPEEEASDGARAHGPIR